jgi:hypothetical protein
LPARAWQRVIFLDEIERNGSYFVCRMFGDMVLGNLRICYSATMSKYVFEPITPARLVENESNIQRLLPSSAALS